MRSSYRSGGSFWSPSAARRFAIGVPLAMAAVSADRVSAEDLHDALAQSYRYSPTLAAARADIGSLGEDVLEARATGRPKFSSITSYAETLKQATPSIFLPDRTLRSDLSLSVPLYRSGVVKYAVKDAQQRYEGGWETLRATTADLFGSVVIAYNDVLRDQTVVQFSLQNVSVLQATLKMARGRYQIGDLTVADIAQSEARLALAQGNLRAARASLISSREEYVRLVGMPPSDLATPAPFPAMPTSVDAAVRVALQDNGLVRAARLKVTAADYRIRSAQGERGLRITGVGSAGYFNYLRSFGDDLPFQPRLRGSSSQVGVTLELPLYQSGVPASHVRRARVERGGAIEEEIAVQRGVVAQVRAAFANWRLSLDSAQQVEDAIAANELALKGLRAENAVGTRTLVDVLDAERDLLDSRVTLASIRRDANVSAFALLVLMGQADPEDLGIGLAPGVAVQGPPAPRASWSDWSDGDHLYTPTATRTDDVAPQDGTIPSEDRRGSVIRP